MLPQGPRIQRPPLYPSENPICSGYAQPAKYVAFNPFTPITLNNMKSGGNIIGDMCTHIHYVYELEHFLGFWGKSRILYINQLLALPEI